MKKKYIIIIVIIIVIIVAGILVWKVESRNRAPRFCVERKLEIELGEGVVLVEGEVHKDQGGEECVNAKFRLEKDSIDGLRKKLGECLWKCEVEDAERWQDIQWMKKNKMDLQDKEIIDYYWETREGNKAKTIEINAFIVTDEEGEYYFYIFY